MFNALLHIAACNKFFPGAPQAYLSPDASLYKNLVFCIAEAENKDLHKVLAENNFPVDILYREVDGKVVFIFNHDDKLKGNFRLAAEIIRRLKTEYSSKIFAHCDRVIFEDEFSEHAFYYIFYNYDVPDFKKGILVSHSLFARLKNSYSFAPQKMNGGDFYFLKDEIKKKRTEFFGREKEIKTLQKSYNRLKSELSGINFNSVFISGEPGIGKTALVNYYFNSRYCKNCFYLENENYGSAYGHFVSLLKKIFKDEKPEVSLRAFAAKIKDNKLRSNLNSSIPDLISLLKESSAKNTRDENNENKILAIRNFIGALAYLCSMEKSPLVIAFDDVQWADSRTVKAINFILDDFRNDFERNYSLQFIFIHRTGYKININQDAGEKEEIYLDSLEPEAAKKFIESLLIKSGLTLSKKKQIELLHKSGGNPLFVQEIVEFIKDNKTAIPDSVKEIIKTRLELLPQNLVMFLKISSALGKEIDAKIVNGVLLKYNFNAITEDELYLLFENNFITINDKEIFLKHDLILEGIYDSIEKDEKKLIHERIGFEIEYIYSDKIEHYYFALADHFTKAAHKEKMIEYLEKAGDRAKAEWDLEKARGYYEKYLKEKEKKSLDCNFLVKHCSVLYTLGDWSELKIFINWIKSTDKCDKEIHHSVLLLLAQFYLNTGKFSLALKYFLKVCNFGSPPQKLQAYSGACDLFIKRGKLKDANTFCNKLLLNSKEEDDLVYISKAYNFLARLNAIEGRHEEALKNLRNNYEILRILNNRFLLGETCIKIGSIFFSQKKYLQSAKFFQESYFYFSSIGALKEIAMCLGNMASLDFISDDFTSCEKKLQKQKHIYRLLNDQFNIAILNNSLGNVNMKLGRYNIAQQYFSEMFSISKKLKSIQLMSISYSNLGLINMIKGNYSCSLSFFKKQLFIERSMKKSENIAKCLLNIGCVYRRQERYKHALRNDLKAQKIISENLLDKYLKEVYLNLSENFFYLGRNINALEYIGKFLEIGKFLKNDILYGTFYKFFYIALIDCDSKSTFKTFEILKRLDNILAKIKDKLVYAELSFRYFLFLSIMNEKKIIKTRDFLQYKKRFSKKLRQIYSAFPSHDVKQYIQKISK
ncbi:MAG: AAA family ATPase [Bacteroidetes bacterium]|nr:AAA family ATPase [Bacteroidota bacterium]